jgi:hypothetical protein
VIMRQTKRRISLKKLSRSTWEDLWCLEEEGSREKYGQISLGNILVKSGNIDLWRNV